MSGNMSQNGSDLKVSGQQEHRGTRPHTPNPPELTTPTIFLGGPGALGIIRPFCSHGILWLRKIGPSHDPHRGSGARPGEELPTAQHRGARRVRRVGHGDIR